MESKNLFEKLQSVTEKAGVKNSVGNKYIYPTEYKNLSSRDEKKKSFRRSIQKSLVSILKQDATKENKLLLQEIIDTFFLEKKKVDEIKDVNFIYNFKTDSEKKRAEKTLKELQKIK